MVQPRDTYCTITGISHSTLKTRGCPHCLMDLHPDEGPLTPVSSMFNAC